eukprot:8680777-Ditylum_brightwellii.AAC.1
MAPSRISLHIMETQYSNLTKMSFWTSWNTEYQCHGIESLLSNDLIQWTKACKNVWSSVPV